MPPAGWKGSGSFYNLQQFLDGNQQHADPMANRVAGMGDSYANAATSAAGQTQTRNELTPEARQQVDSNAGQAKALGGLVQTLPGRSTLAQSAFSRDAPGGYTAGMARLDGFLMGADPGANKTLSDAGQRWGGLKKSMDDHFGALDAQRAEAEKKKAEAEEAARRSAPASMPESQYKPFDLPPVLAPSQQPQVPNAFPDDVDALGVSRRDPKHRNSRTAAPMWR